MACDPQKKIQETQSGTILRNLESRAAPLQRSSNTKRIPSRRLGCEQLAPIRTDHRYLVPEPPLTRLGDDDSHHLTDLWTASQNRQENLASTDPETVPTSPCDRHS